MEERMSRSGQSVVWFEDLSPEAYRAFLEKNDIREEIKGLTEDLRAGDLELEEAGERIRGLILDGDFPSDVMEEVREAYGELSGRYGADRAEVA